MSTISGQPIAYQQRRTFAIIAHPDAGKTTLTEKLLLFGGAIQLAGAVKARGDRRRARSDWMKVEQERGISVTASVMTFEYNNCLFNLIDTPGHQDFSEDTYRTLSAVDSAVMVIDCAKGIEAQTLKLFEVCRLRNIPIITFINKMDREGRDPFDLLSEIQEKLALDVTPASWPIGMGRNFLGCYDIFNQQLLLFERAKGDVVTDAVTIQGLQEKELKDHLPPAAIQQLMAGVEMAEGLFPAFTLKDFHEGHLTPVYFGSAVNNFGIRELLQGLTDYAPSPRPRATLQRQIQPSEKAVTGFVFKIQANMNPKHRDRIAFIRLCSGIFQGGKKLFHVRTGKSLLIHNPLLFLAQSRELVEEAAAGDIIGIPNHGTLRIGDSLSEGEVIQFTGIPNFAPEILQIIRPQDPMRAKHLAKALQHLAEEGIARILRPRLGLDWIVGVVGSLQFDVLADRIRTEYDIPVRFEASSVHAARWLASDQPAMLERFISENQASMADDHDGIPVFLARNLWHLERAEKDWPAIRFLKVREQQG